jgi:hypothetical protein
MKTPHYLRFVQALVLAATVPACSSADAPAPPTTSTEPAAQTAEPATPSSGEPAPAPMHAAQASADAHSATDADAGVDGSLPFSSGPIVPPELPAALS